MDWAAMFALDLPIWEAMLRGTLIYLGVVVFVRLFGQREVGSLSLPDLIVIVLISEAVSNGMSGNDDSVTTGLVLALTILVWSWVLDFLAYRFTAVERLLKPSKRTLIENGKVNEKAMRRQLLSKTELDAALRLHGIKDVNDVDEAYIEPNGQISAFKKDAAK